MRELSHTEIEAVSGGAQRQPPIGARTAGEYFGRCMEYTNPSASWGAGWAVAGAIFRTVGWAGAAWAGGTGAVCALGSIQYMQR